MNIRIIADSSANIYPTDEPAVPHASLTIVTSEKEYVDNDALDVYGMIRDLKAYKGKSSTACPSVQEWTDAFGNADMVFGVAITSNLSGCYNSGCVAAEAYMEANPGTQVFILDSLSTGPEMELILEKYHELVAEGKPFDEVVTAIKAYHSHTHLYFSLSSLDNLSKNGRVSMVVAKAVGLLGIKMVGRASTEGTLEPMHKCIGDKRAARQMLQMMEDAGFTGGKVRLGHTYNEPMANEFAAMVREKWPGSDIKIKCNRGLVSFYAEEGSLLVGFES